MVKCPECGTVLNEDDKRCPKCGHKITEEKTSAREVSKNKIIAAVAVIVIIAVVGIIASGVLSGDSISSDVSQSTLNSAGENSTNTSDNTPSQYWASAKSDKFHRPTCEWAKKISEENKITYPTREDALDDGKKPCDECNP